MVKSILLKLALFLGCLPMMAMAMTPSKQTLVGDWLCTTDDDDYVSSALIRYRADGTASEMIEYQEKDSFYPLVELVFANYRWELKGDKLYMTDTDDLAYYASYYNSAYDGGMVRMSDETTQEMKLDVINSYKENNWHYIKFHGSNKHDYYFEDGFMGDCRRLK